MKRNRKRLTQEEANGLGLEVKPNDEGRSTSRYMITEAQLETILDLRGAKGKKVTKKSKKDDDGNKFDLAAWTADGRIMDIDEFCAHHGLSRGDIRTWRLCTHTKVPTYNISFKENVEIAQEITYDFIDEIVAKHVATEIPEPTPRREVLSTDTFDRVVLTDVHIGMDTNKSGNGLYGGVWNKSVLLDRMYEMAGYIIQNKKSNMLVIDDLGDYLDGWDAQTTRKGHALPQNMSNKEAFEAGIEFKVKLVGVLAEHYGTILINNICEDNHSGDFGYVVNSAVKSILELQYPNVIVDNHEKFINHYYVGEHAFVISHGKDSKNLKFGFKPHLDPKQVEKIDQYCKVNGIYKHSSFVEFSKGDSHQMIMDYATSDDFDYCNYPAFSPSSEWVQTNFKRGRSGFVFSTIEKERNIKTSSTYWFNAFEG